MIFLSNNTIIINNQHASRRIVVLLLLMILIIVSSSKNIIPEKKRKTTRINWNDPNLRIIIDNNTNLRIPRGGGSHNKIMNKDNKKLLSLKNIWDRSLIGKLVISTTSASIDDTKKININDEDLVVILPKGKKLTTTKKAKEEFSSSGKNSIPLFKNKQQIANNNNNTIKKKKATMEDNESSLLKKPFQTRTTKTITTRKKNNEDDDNKSNNDLVTTKTSKYREAVKSSLSFWNSDKDALDKKYQERLKLLRLRDDEDDTTTTNNNKDKNNNNNESTSSSLSLSSKLKDNRDKDTKTTKLDKKYQERLTLLRLPSDHHDEDNTTTNNKSNKNESSSLSLISSKLKVIPKVKSFAKEKIPKIIESSSLLILSTIQQYKDMDFRNLSPKDLSTLGIGSGIIIIPMLIQLSLGNNNALNNDENTIILPPMTATDITIIFHFNDDDNDSTTLDSLVTALENEEGNKSLWGSPNHHYVRVINCSTNKRKKKYSLSQTSLLAERVGKRVAQQLLQSQYLSQKVLQSNNDGNNILLRIHVMGVSSGAMAADTCIKTLRKEFQFPSQLLYLQETLFDPILQRCYNSIGYYANYAQQILFTVRKRRKAEDYYLQHCAVWDITNLNNLNDNDSSSVLWYNKGTKKLNYDSKTSVVLPIGFVPEKYQLRRGNIVLLEEK